ncbi:hypothetical protein ACS0TY_027753 [Phlomoides rotata]
MGRAASYSFTVSVGVDFVVTFLLISRQGLRIDFPQYEHPVILTMEAGTKYVGNMKGALSKNLFLKDKKQRYYIVSALVDTKVDLKAVLQFCLREKGGLRMAPEEALSEILQVPLGCVTPLALANPTVGKDQPPDLAALVPSSDTIVLTDPLEKPGTPQGSEKKHISSNDQPTVVTVTKAAKPSKASTKETPSGATNTSITYAGPTKFVEEILEKTRSILLSEEIYKNTAYTEGFKAGIHHQPKRV